VTSKRVSLDRHRDRGLTEVSGVVVPFGMDLVERAYVLCKPGGNGRQLVRGVRSKDLPMVGYVRLEEVGRKLSAAGGARRGRETVRLTDVVGSVDRCSEFDMSFFPLR
jgi:hypothetical protein